MTRKAIVDKRRALAAAAAGLLAALPVPAPAGAASQPACQPPGDTVTPVPWSQLMLAPEQAWPHTTGGGQRVAVVSTGVSDTPYLAGAVRARVDLAPPPRFGEPSGEQDCLGLGTGIAGLIAAEPRDGVGFHGMAPDAAILDAKIVGDQFPSGQQPSTSVPPGTLAAGIEWAVEQDATVIAVPIVSYQDSEALGAAVARALAAGIVVVASVGEPPNRGAAGEPPGSGDEPAVETYPAAYEGVIGVAALASDGTAGLSLTSHVDLVAPGVDLVTTYPGDGLGPAGGTGFAAAYVAGSAALVRAYRPELPADEVARRLYATATPAAEGVGSPRYGYGIVNPYQAVLDRVVEGDPAALPGFTPERLSAEELARRADRRRSDTLASRLAFGALVAAAVLAVMVGLVTRARRRGWRLGIAAMPPERPEAHHPEPPRELFDIRRQ